MRYGTDPRSADTDQDGLADGAELAAGMDPRSFDTDADGLADSVDANPTNSDGNCYGQGTNWVAAVYGTNAAAIIAAGYTNWIAATVVSDTNAWYSFTVSITTLDASGHALIIVGDQHVVANAHGDYVFLLEQGAQYAVNVVPSQGITLTASEPTAVIVPPGAAAGSVTVPAGITVTPSAWHFPSVDGQTFTLSLSHVSPDLVGDIVWSCPDPRVSLASSGRFAVTVSCSAAATWWTMLSNLVCRAVISGRLHTVSVPLSFGEETEPRLVPELSVAPGIWFNKDDDNADGLADWIGDDPVTGEDDLVPLTIRFTAPWPTNGTLRLAWSGRTAGVRLWKGTDRSGGPWTTESWTLDNAQEFSATCYVEGLSASPATGDITVRLTFTEESGRETSAEVSTCVCDINTFTIEKSADLVTWTTVGWPLVVLDGEAVRFHVGMTPVPVSLAAFEALCPAAPFLRIYTQPSATSFDVVASRSVPFADCQATLADGTVTLTFTADQLRSFGLVSKAEDNIDEKCSADLADWSTPQPGKTSLRQDSDAFDAGVAGVQRGRARGVAGNIASFPSEGAFTKTFFQAAGALDFDMVIGNARSPKRLLQNQADVFYYSGHGNHANAALASGTFSPTDVGTLWDDIDVFIVAGCSILDINDYNNFFKGADHTRSPGKDWEAVDGPNVFLGYDARAPGDVKGAPLTIMNAFLANRSAKGDVLAWLEANQNIHATYACAIRKGVGFWYLKRAWLSTKIIMVPKGDW